MDILTPEQHKTLQRLKEHDVFFFAVQNAFNHIVITDTEGVILYANQATQRITGYSQQEIIGKTPRLWGGIMERSVYEKLWHTIKIDRHPYMGILTNRRKSGETYQAQVIISPVVCEKAKLLGFIGTEQDVIKEWPPIIQ